MDDYARETTDGTVLACRAVPSASKTCIADVTPEGVRIRIAAPPVDGKANRELVKFLAKLFKVPKDSVEILGGETGKMKRILLRGISPAEVRQKISEARK